MQSKTTALPCTARDNAQFHGPPQAVDYMIDTLQALQRPAASSPAVDIVCKNCATLPSRQFTSLQMPTLRLALHARIRLMLYMHEGV